VAVPDGLALAVEVGCGDGDAAGPVVAVGDGLGDADGDGLRELGAVGDSDGDGVGEGEAVEACRATVSVVAHGSFAAQRLPFAAAAVVSLVPAGAPVATLASKLTVADRGAPWVPSAGTVQVSFLEPALSVRPRFASSAVDVVIFALPSRPERSSTTTAPECTDC
jgi:hypothetical protein